MEIIDFPIANHIGPQSNNAGWYEVYSASAIASQLGEMGLVHGVDFEFYGLEFHESGTKCIQYSFINAEDAMLAKIKGINNIAP